MSSRAALYSAVDDVLTHYEVDVADAALVRRSSIRLPAKVQYAWAHPSGKFLYATTTNGGPRVASDRNHLSALAIDPQGAPSLSGERQPLRLRAVHVCLHPSGHYALDAHNYLRGGLSVHRIEPSGVVGDEISQRPDLDFGTYPHQVMVSPSGRTAMIVDRGINAQGTEPERPGALRTFAFADGQLGPGQVVAPNGGYGFGPRHVVFHPTKPWLYACDERTNKLYMFRFDGEVLSDAPAFTLDTLADPAHVRPRQLGGGIKLHPGGNYLYVANRSDHSVEQDGRKIFAGGENNIAVYALDPATGEPRLIQHADTQSFHVRTFACDPSGRLLVTASIKALYSPTAHGAQEVAAALSVFRIDPQGRLAFVRKYDVETSGSQLQYWMGIVGLA